MSTSALQKGREIAHKLNPDLKTILDERYDDIVPGFTDTLLSSLMDGFMPVKVWI